MECGSVFQKLVNHNPDLARLVERGYAVAFDQGHLIIRDIPYLDPEGNLKLGAIVSKLVAVDSEVMRQEDHQIYFAGSHPHDLHGCPVSNMGGGPKSIALAIEHSDVVVQRSFSNKPKDTGKFPDHFAKVESYVAIISGPAIEKHGVTPYTFKVDKTEVADPIFKLQDTLTSRAGIAELNVGFENEKIAIIGLGGTGATAAQLRGAVDAITLRVYGWRANRRTSHVIGDPARRAFRMLLPFAVGRSRNFCHFPDR